MINDEAISFSTLKRFQTEIAIRDRQIEFLIRNLEAVMQHAQAVLAAFQESNAPDQPH